MHVLPPSLRRPLRLRPLRAHLQRLVISTVLPVLLFMVVLLLWLVRDNRAAIERRVLQSARAQAAVVDREMAALLRTLRVIAQSELLDSGDLQPFYHAARRLLAAEPSWHTLVLLDRDGRHLVNARLPWGPPQRRVVDSESLKRVLETRQPTVGALHAGPEGTLAFAVRVPVLRGDELRYVLTAVLTPAALADMVARQLPPSDEWMRGIVDGRGTIVARTEPEQFIGQPSRPQYLDRIRASAEAVYRTQTADGKPVYVAFSRAPLSGWTASVSVPTDVLDAPFRRSLSALGAWGALMLVASGFGAYLLSRRLTTDLRAVATAAEALTHGAAPPVAPSVVSEVVSLYDSLQDSAALLARRQRERDEHLARAEAARAESDAANRTKDEFLAMLGHELRNPLAPIVTALDLLKRRGNSGSREYAIIARQVRHMVRLVDDLLDISRITRGDIKLQCEVVAVSALVTKAVEMAGPLYEERRHHLEVAVADGAYVYGDPARLAQVIANLLVNAAKYTPPEGAVQIRAGVEGSLVVIEVSDNGQGLSAELLPRVFDAFIQGPRGSDRREGGLGLGLALVRSLVLQHGGTVKARSPGPGQGSQFEVRLPAALAPTAVAASAAPAPPATTVRAPAPRPARGSALVVDDNHDAARLLADVLIASGLQVEVAPDGPAALALLDRFLPTIAVLDIGLPLMDGYELAVRIRAKLGAAAPAFIAVTGYGQATDLSRSRAAGFQEHFVKPVDIDAFLDSIQTLAGGPASPSR